MILVGGTAHHMAGWTTQRFHVLHVAYPDHYTPPSGPAVIKLPRSFRWYQALMRSAEPSFNGYLVASAPMALADTILSQAPWLSPEDISVPGDVVGAYADTLAALQALGARDPARMLEAYRDRLTENEGSEIRRL